MCSPFNLQFSFRNCLSDKTKQNNQHLLLVLSKCGCDYLSVFILLYHLFSYLLTVLIHPPKARIQNGRKR